MSLQVEKLEKNMAKLTIEVSADDLEKALQNAYMKQKNRIALPGFRKGKVPRQMIEKMYGAEIFYDDAANELIPKAYADAYDESGLEIVSRPDIQVVQIEKGKPFIFTAEVATKPEVTLGEYKGLEVDKVSTRVTQKEVDARVQEEAEKNARTVTVTDRGVQDGDEIILDFEGFVDGEAFEGGKGENYPLTIGSGSFIPGFEDQLIGAEAEKEVEVTDEAGETTVETVTETVGVVETLAPEVEVSTESPEESQVVEDLRPDVIVDDSNNVGIEAGHIEVSEELSEDQLISMDSIIEYWQTEPRLGEDYLDYVLSNSGLSSLSDESKAHIKETLMKYYPHTDTVPYEQIQNELYN